MNDENPLGVTLAMDFAIAAVYERRAYHSAIEQAISEKVSWRLNSINRRSAELPIAERVNFEERNYLYRWALSFPQDLRAHVIVGALSFLEYQLIQLCENIACDTDSIFKRPGQNKLENCRSYLLKQGINVQEKTVWEKLVKCQKFRNSLVHNGMDINLENIENLKEFSLAIPGIVNDEERGYILAKEACEEVFFVVENVLKEFRKSVAEKCK